MADYLRPCGLSRLPGTKEKHMHPSSSHLTALAADVQNISRPLAVLVPFIILVAIALYVSALISIISSRAGNGMKFAWIIFCFIAPVVGSLLWFLVGRRNVLRSPTTF
ncbi:PLD nuclease N-terminal domain-containing protein [Streptomyces sp. NPDC006711]|uniref:PLD nuclease N-terminal domain-containing protein n=1 Tax=Streptomyces sp. NPDC006711 TaxID=3364762 RepID=UPI003673F07E